MSDLTVAPKKAIDEVMAEVAQLSTDDLRKQLVVSLRVTATQLVRLAGIVRTLEERGENLDDFKGALPTYLRKIAYGQLLPEVVVRFSEARGILHRISQLPLPEQKRLAAGEPVPVAVQREDGLLDHRMIDPLALRGPLLTQVFGPDRIRDAAEQAAIIEARKALPQQPKRQAKQRVRADKARGGILVGRQFATAAEVLTALAALRDGEVLDDVPYGDRQQLGIFFTDAEHKRLKIMAAQGDTSMSGLIRRAMAAAGLIGQKEESL